MVSWGVLGCQFESWVQVQTYFYLYISNKGIIYQPMGQKCCAQVPQRQYSKMNADKPNTNGKSNPITESTDIPDGLETVPIPHLSREVNEVCQTLTPYYPKSANGLKGVPGDPKLLNAQGTVYAGEWKDCMPHGKGIMYFSDGSLYEGMFNEGTPDKEGRLINSNGVYYEGQISNGEASGQGKLVNSHRKYSYQGNWKNDIPQGKGIEKWGNDAYYDGTYQEGVKQGTGRYLQKNNFEYNGVFENNQINHNGRVEFKNGDSYQGMWKDGLMNGYGIYTYKDGSEYSGNFINGKKNGKGKYKDNNGAIFEGNWKNGKRNGKGTLKVAGLNDIIQWQWKNDLPVQVQTQ